MPEQENFGIILGRVFRDPALSIEAKAIYGYLCIFADKDGSCCPSVAIMCKELKISETRFYRYMKELTSAGVVTVKQTRSGSRFAKNIYEVDRPTVSPLRGFKGTETRAPNSPGCRITETENEGINNTSLTSTRRINNTSLNNFVEQICKLLNEGKRKAFSKGRLKPETGKLYIGKLLADGISENQIMEEARNIANAGIDIDWFSFGKQCRKRR